MQNYPVGKELMIIILDYFRFDFPIVTCLLLAFIFWVFRVIKVVYNVFLYLEIRSFYSTALKISSVSVFFYLEIRSFYSTALKISSVSSSI